jgi:hypothetical protein
MAATVAYYSDSEEFLCGIAAGIMDFAGDDVTTADEDDVIPSDEEGYEWMLKVDDQRATVSEKRYYSGASLLSVEKLSR